MIPIRSLVPGFLFPLRLFVGSVYCDSCMRYYYRIRLLGWKIETAGPPPKEGLR
jgi:hypothetical protein